MRYPSVHFIIHEIFCSRPPITQSARRSKYCPSRSISSTHAKSPVSTGPASEGRIASPVDPTDALSPVCFPHKDTFPLSRSGLRPIRRDATPSASTGCATGHFRSTNGRSAWPASPEIVLLGDSRFLKGAMNAAILLCLVPLDEAFSLVSIGPTFRIPLVFLFVPCG
jgi:hypothetical protein